VGGALCYVTGPEALGPSQSSARRSTAPCSCVTYATRRLPVLREGAEGAGDGVARLSLVADGCRRERGGASPGWPR